ncbi:GIN domain-containing protein [Parvularcula oceani]|uniref:GIN domain-containing protein n=1 Tax=Parvularcula oceani TaxID=1247963 RepID=UPI0004E0BE81|nr:DUF2807 domain-containing protein [Parvularcula oceani]
MTMIETLNRRRALLLAGAAALGLSAAPAMAQQDSFDDVTGIVIDDAIATVSVRLTDADAVTVRVSGGEERPLAVTEEDGLLRIAGERGIDPDRFWRDYDRDAQIRIGPIGLKLGGGRVIQMQGGENPHFNEMLERYPLVEIEAPEGADLTFEGSALRLRVSGDAGRVEAADNLYVVASLGNAAAADISVEGASDYRLGDISGPLEAAISGSGDLRFGAAREADLSVHGSGDIEGGDVAEDVSARIDGSGDIILGEIGGEAVLEVHGSGDIEANRAGTGLQAFVNGSGDISVGEIAGRVSAGVNGSGDVKISGGRAEAFEGSVHGSGDLIFGGLAVAPRLFTQGSGDIEIEDAEGEVEARGDGIRVAGRSYEND